MPVCLICYVSLDKGQKHTCGHSQCDKELERRVKKCEELEKGDKSLQNDFEIVE